MEENENNKKTPLATPSFNEVGEFIGKKILIFSDLHLYPHNKNEVYIGRIEKFLNNIISICEKKDINTILFLGDWFHRKEKIGVKEINITTRFFKKLQQKNIKIIMLTGNHDSLSVHSFESNRINSIVFLNLLNNVIIVDDYLKIQTKDVTFHFLAWIDREFVKGVDIQKELLKKIDKNKKNVFLGHLDLLNYYTGNIDENNKSNFIDYKFLKENYDFSFLGHIHKIIKKENVLYVGSPYQQSFSEEGDIKGVFIFDRENFKISFIKTKIFPEFKTLYLDKILKNKKIIDNLKTIKNKFIRIYINTNVTGSLLYSISEILEKNNYSVVLLMDYSENNENILLDDNKENESQEESLKEIKLLNTNNYDSLMGFFKKYVGMTFVNYKFNEKFNIKEEDTINFISSILLREN